jgi:serine/threonine protein kinase
MRGVFSLPEYVSEEGADLIKRLLTVNPKRRITIEEIRNHEWVKKGGMCFKLGRPIKLESIKKSVNKNEISPKPKRNLDNAQNHNENIENLGHDLEKFVSYKFKAPHSGKNKNFELSEKEKSEFENAQYQEKQQKHQEEIKSYISKMKKIVLRDEPSFNVSEILPIDNEFVTNIEISFNNNFNNIVVNEQNQNLNKSICNARPFRIRSKTPIRDESVNNNTEIIENR